jgi:hypothetical protein
MGERYQIDEKTPRFGYPPPNPLGFRVRLAEENDTLEGRQKLIICLPTPKCQKGTDTESGSQRSIKTRSVKPGATQTKPACAGYKRKPT